MRFSTFLFSIALCLLSVPGRADDTVRIMQYNLLNYGNSANPPAYKNARLSTIFSHVRPDVLGVNEVFSQPALLDSILKVLGPGWAHSAFSNAGGQTQTNALFYRADLFRLRGQTVIDSTLRDIIAYDLQYRDTTGLHPDDSAELTVVVCHLRASNSAEDAADRADEAASISAWIEARGDGAYLVMGDLNVYTSAEAAYEILTGRTAPTAARLFDPLDRPGAWSGDPGFADLHTQSPRASFSLGDGGATGGLDDRFDQILISGPVTNGWTGVRILPGSYLTIGQDGLHFNDSLTAWPPNEAAPTAVVQALFENSDHLPVAADFIIGGPPVAISNRTPAQPSMHVVNPIGNWLEIRPGTAFGTGPLTIALYSLQGAPVLRIQESAPGPVVRHRIGSDVPPGTYTLVVTGPSGERLVVKVVRE